MEGSLTVDQRRERIAAARDALTGIDGSLWQVPGGGGGLAGLLGEVDALGAVCEAAKVAIVADAMERGDTSDGAAAMTVTQCVRHHAPSTRAGGAGQLVAVAQAFGKPVNSPVMHAVQSGVLPVRSAAMVLAEADRLRPVLVDGAQPPVLAGLIEMAALHGPRGWCGRRCWPNTAAMVSCSPSRTSRAGSWPCRNRSRTAPGPRSTGWSWTWRARPCSWQSSARCRRLGRCRVSATCAAATSAAGRRW